MACNIELETEPAAVATASRATAASVPANAPTVAPEPETVTAQPLLPDFRDNEIRGSQPHKRPVRYVPDRIDDIRDGGSGCPIDPGYEGNDWDFSRVHCQLRAPEREAELRVGQSVTVQGLIAGLGLFNVIAIEDRAVTSAEADRQAQNAQCRRTPLRPCCMGYIESVIAPMQARCGWTGRLAPPSMGISTAMRAIEAGVQYGRMQGVRTP